MYKCKITVIKKELFQDVAEKYGNPEPGIVVCPRFEVGQEFILEGTGMPEGFCNWAWADIQRDVVGVLFGASYPWIKGEHCLISCCTDGIRPVVFKIERIEVED